MADIRRMYGKWCDVPNMHWNAIKCLMSFGWLWVIWARFALRALWAAQIALKSPKPHNKDSQAGKWTLLLHFSAYSGHRIISHTFFLCPPLTINLGYLWFDTLENTGEDKDYKTATDKLSEYFSPQTNIAYEVYNFRQAKQKEGEKVLRKSPPKYPGHNK